IYYVPWMWDHSQVFDGFTFHNTLSSETGEKVKGAIYDITSDGAVGDLNTYFGEATLDGTAARRNLATSFTSIAGRWYALALCGDSATTLAGMAPTVSYSSSGGGQAGNTGASRLGLFS